MHNLDVRGLEPRSQFHQKDPQERDERKKKEGAGEGDKARNFGPPTLRSGPPTFLGSGPPRSAKILHFCDWAESPLCKNHLVGSWALWWDLFFEFNHYAIGALSVLGPSTSTTG